MRFFGFTVMFLGLRMSSLFIEIGQNSERLESKLCAFSLVLLFSVAAYSGFRIAVDDKK